MNLLLRKSSQAAKAAKGAANLFEQATKKFKKSNTIAQKAIVENNIKAEKLSKETQDMAKLQTTNNIAINNLEHFFTQPLAPAKELVKESVENEETDSPG